MFLIVYVKNKEGLYMIFEQVGEDKIGIDVEEYLVLLKYAEELKELGLEI